MKSNLKDLWYKKQVEEQRTITPHSASAEMNIRPDTIRLWLRSTPIRLDRRIMESWCKFLNVDEIVINPQEGEIEFKKKGNTDDR